MIVGDGNDVIDGNDECHRSGVQNKITLMTPVIPIIPMNPLLFRHVPDLSQNSQ